MIDQFNIIISRCSCPTLWLAFALHFCALWLWNIFFYWTRLILSKSLVTFYSTQWNKRSYSYTIDWSVFSTGHWTWVTVSSSNVQDGAILDIVMNGFWGEGQGVHLLMFIFLIHLLHAASFLSACYNKHECMKNRAYGQRIREIEHASFTPVVMLATNRLAHEATYFYKRLASLLSHKWGDEYSVVIGRLQYSLSFSLLCSAIQCVCGVHSSIWHHVVAPPPMDLVRVESNKSLKDDHRR